MKDSPPLSPSQTVPCIYVRLLACLRGGEIVEGGRSPLSYLNSPSPYKIKDAKWSLGGAFALLIKNLSPSFKVGT